MTTYKYYGLVEQDVGTIAAAIEAMSLTESLDGISQEVDGKVEIRAVFGAELSTLDLVTLDAYMSGKGFVR